jgi:hypothetical protein
MTVSLPNNGDGNPPLPLKPKEVTENNDDNVSAWRHGLDEQLRNVDLNNNMIWMNPISNNNDFRAVPILMTPIVTEWGSSSEGTESW